MRLLLSVVLLAGQLPLAAEANTQSYQCPNGSVVETTVQGSREQRKKTADLKIDQLPQSFSELPGWQQRLAPESLLKVIESNCKTSRLPEGWGRVCNEAKGLSADDVYDYLEENFTPFQLVVGGTSDGKGKIKNHDKGKFTSYYASYVNVSKNKTDKYKHPIYKISVKAKSLSRRQIEQGGLAESEVLFWSDSAFDNFILHVQGSGVGKLPDGSKVKVLYGGKNKENYVSLGKVLRECGEIPAAKISLPSIRAWVEQSSPIEYQRLIGNNQSYVFFKEEAYNGDSPRGALGVPLTTMRSLAVDTRYIPLGTMAYVAVPHPLNETKIERVFIAQDKGGAINGGIRADIFAGEGDAAAKFAGKMAHKGQFWLIKPKKEAATRQ